eukprot:CAMPEP_0169276606 /NCGR_PEP_ID=MMETSP1016-20121227/53124_1 /TAXON_ID=342587 /ORGANISM="Karlodinium micrum, Strain CCMP2283" /LENGTH=89 /DNA_ID=CAMNT_0009363797 /DNA_START=212 /DNA_END=481 /DNA_ORIENTATION=+
MHGQPEIHRSVKHLSQIQMAATSERLSHHIENLAAPSHYLPLTAHPMQALPVASPSMPMYLYDADPTLTRHGQRPLGMCSPSTSQPVST